MNVRKIPKSKSLIFEGRYLSVRNTISDLNNLVSQTIPFTYSLFLQLFCPSGATAIPLGKKVPTARNICRTRNNDNTLSAIPARQAMAGGGTKHSF